MKIHVSPFGRTPMWLKKLGNLFLIICLTSKNVCQRQDETKKTKGSKHNCLGNKPQKMGGKIKRVECNTIIIAGATVSDGELTMYIY